MDQKIEEKLAQLDLSSLSKGFRNSKRISMNAQPVAANSNNTPTKPTEHEFVKPAPRYESMTLGRNLKRGPTTMRTDPPARGMLIHFTSENPSKTVKSR